MTEIIKKSRVNLQNIPKLWVQLECTFSFISDIVWFSTLSPFQYHTKQVGGLS